MRTLIEEIEKSVNTPLDLDRLRNRIVLLDRSKNFRVEYPAFSIKILEENYLQMIFSGELVEFEPHWNQRPDYASYDLYGTVNYWFVLLYVNDVKCIEDFKNFDTIIVPGKLFLDSLYAKGLMGELDIKTEKIDISSINTVKEDLLKNRIKNIISSSGFNIDPFVLYLYTDEDSPDVKDKKIVSVNNEKFFVNKEDLRKEEYHKFVTDLFDDFVEDDEDDSLDFVLYWEHGDYGDDGSRDYDKEIENIITESEGDDTEDIVIKPFVIEDRGGEGDTDEVRNVLDDTLDTEEDKDTKKRRRRKRRRRKKKSKPGEQPQEAPTMQQPCPQTKKLLDIEEEIEITPQIRKQKRFSLKYNPVNETSVIAYLRHNKQILRYGSDYSVYRSIDLEIGSDGKVQGRLKTYLTWDSKVIGKGITSNIDRAIMHHMSSVEMYRPGIVLHKTYNIRPSIKFKFSPKPLVIVVKYFVDPEAQGDMCQQLIEMGNINISGMLSLSGVYTDSIKLPINRSGIIMR